MLILGYKNPFTFHLNFSNKNMTEIQYLNTKCMFIQIFNRFISLFVNNMYGNIFKIHYKPMKYKF